MPYITKQNQAITADRNWLVSKQYDARWSPSEKGAPERYRDALQGEVVRQYASCAMERAA